jgi:NAD dependent epimerase/dehydratase family enzyme
MSAGPVNAVAPQAARHVDIVQAMAQASGARLILAVPARMLRLALGEMSGLFLDSQRVSPNAASAAGFTFRFATIESAVANLLQRPRSQDGRSFCRVRP